MCRQTAQRLFSHMGIDRTWQSSAVKICQRDTFLSCTLTFPVRNLSRNLPRAYWKIGKNIRDTVGLGCGKEKRLETSWGKKKKEVKWQRVAVFTIIERVTDDHNDHDFDAQNSLKNSFGMLGYILFMRWIVFLEFSENNGKLGKDYISQVGIYFLLVGWIVRFYPTFTEFLEKCKKLGQRLMTS